MKRLISLIPMLALCLVCTAQEDDNVISPDRPGTTTSVDIVPLHALQWETGLSYEKDETKGNVDEYEKIWTINNSIFRYGLTKNAELFFEIEVQSKKTGMEDWYTGLSKIGIGTKIMVFESVNPMIPNVSFLGSVAIPGKSKSELLPDYIGGNLHVLANSQLTPWFDVGLDAGITWDDNERQPITFLGTGFTFSVAQPLSLYIEQYNYIHHGGSSKIEAGMAFLASNRVQFDMGASLSLNNISSFFNAFIGVAWKIL